MHSRLERQIEFIVEAEGIKHIERQNTTLNGARRETDGEHSWQLALMALVLSEHAREPALDCWRVVKMVLIHDLVELDAGDVHIYDDAGLLGKAAREQAGAERLFGLLPDDQRDEFMRLWQEFESRETPEAKFAASLDRLAPVMANHHTAGGAWARLGIPYERIVERTRHIAEGSQELGELAMRLIDETSANGYLVK